MNFSALRAQFSKLQESEVFGVYNFPLALLRSASRRSSSNTLPRSSEASAAASALSSGFIGSHKTCGTNRSTPSGVSEREVVSSLDPEATVMRPLWCCCIQPSSGSTRAARPTATVPMRLFTNARLTILGCESPNAVPNRLRSLQKKKRIHDSKQKWRVEDKLRSHSAFNQTILLFLSRLAGRYSRPCCNA